jgi:glycosyltransferase involved in cell wall biosynthesis
MAENSLRIAFVVQRYGLEVNGGAELHCRWVAEHLVKYAQVHVFTTCAQDYTTWNNIYPTDDKCLNGVHVHRYAVDRPRTPQRFAQISDTVFSEPHSSLDELEWMREQGPVSTALLADIERRQDDFDVFIFFTYLYATTYYGIQLVPHKAMLVPTAHDEPSLYLKMYRSTFHLPRCILYNTEAERRMVQHVFRNHRVPSVIVGTGIDVPNLVNPNDFRDKYRIDRDFILYIGRLDESKNLGELLEFWQRYQEASNSRTRLVLLGKGPYAIAEQDNVLPLGFVSEEDKFNALAASSLLILPSRYESLSMVMLEAWLMGKPVLVNGFSEVLRQQCLRSDGGLYYQDYTEFATALDLLLNNTRLRHEIGQNGRAFASEIYSWEAIERKYLHAILYILDIQRSVS